MIRFACPRCKTVHERPENEAGSKFACPNCQQRLQVPLPPENKTMIGSLVAPGRNPIAPPPAVPREPRPVTTIPVANDAWDDEPVAPPRRSRRADYDDDFDIARPSSRAGRGYALEECTRAANVGFLCALVSLGLIFAAMIVWLVIVAEHPRSREMAPFVFLILAIGIASFVLGLIGTIFASRGLDPVNTHNRGLAIAGLICGILGMVIGLIGSAIFFCIGMVVLSFR